MSDKKTAIITGASQGIGAGLVAAFLKEGYNVVATSRNVKDRIGQTIGDEDRLPTVDCSAARVPPCGPTTNPSSAAM